MKNPTQPNFKTEWYPIFIIVLSAVASYIFRNSFQNLVYFWPIMIVAVYSMFLFFPFFTINHKESAALKDQWHKAK